MKNLLVGVTAAALALVPTGCNKSGPGGDTANKDSDAQFTISQTGTGSAVRTGLKKDETKSFELAVKAKSAFTGKVALKAEPSNAANWDATLEPKSVDLTPNSDVKVTLKVTNKGGATGDAAIKVTGTPDKGGSTYIDVQVKGE